MLLNVTTIVYLCMYIPQINNLRTVIVLKNKSLKYSYTYVYYFFLIDLVILIQYMFECLIFIIGGFLYAYSLNFVIILRILIRPSTKRSI